MVLDTTQSDCEWIISQQGHKSRPLHIFKAPYIVGGERLRMTTYLGVVAHTNDGRYRWTRLRSKWAVPQGWNSEKCIQGTCKTLEEAKAIVEQGFAS